MEFQDAIALYLVRHTTPKTESGLCYGQSEVALADSFRREAEEVQQKLSSVQDANVFSSGFERCRRLAQVLDENYEEDVRLSELNFGAWEMKKWDDLEPQDVRNWMDDFVNLRVPQGESFADLQRRTELFIQEMLHHRRPAIIISHAGPIRAMLCGAIGLPLERAFRLEVPYSSVSRIDYIPSLKRFLLKYVNY